MWAFSRTQKKGCSSAKLIFEQGPSRKGGAFLVDPDVNTASVNAGDHRLYVGGGSLNKVFAEELGSAQP